MQVIEFQKHDSVTYVSEGIELEAVISEVRLNQVINIVEYKIHYRDDDSSTGLFSALVPASDIKESKYHVGKPDE